MIAFFVTTPHGERECDSLEEANALAAAARTHYGDVVNVEARDVEVDDPMPVIQPHPFAPGVAACAMCGQPERYPLHHALFAKAHA